MKTLITGGAGFIGANLCRRLLSEGNEVICMDNFFSGRRKNVEGLLSDPRFTLIETDVREAYDIPCDAIYNLACPASPPFYQSDPLFIAETCFLGMRNALENARRYDAKVLQASTSEVYGDPMVHPQSESYLGNVNPDGIRSCYDEGKRIAETLCMDYHRQYGVDTHIVRIFNTYGPYMRPDDGRIITQALRAALTDTPLTVYGDGTQTRSFQYIDDLLDGMMLLMESDIHTPVNIGNPEEQTIRELIAHVSDITGRKIQVVFAGKREDDPVRRCPDISLAKEHLHWEPRVSTYEGINKMFNHIKIENYE